MIEDFVAGRKKIAVVGMGYVGLPLCISMGKVFAGVIGFDISTVRIQELQSGHDRTLEVSPKDVAEASVLFTTDPAALKEASIIIVAVPTPINSHKIPDLKPLQSASEIVGRNLSRGAVVVYESTVYPGVTEDICGPLIEKHSGLKAGKDFALGYSPERINPGDKVHTVENIVKVVSAQDSATTELLAALYGKIIKAGIYKAHDIKTAESAKVIENIQRDLNIALINELSIIFHRLGVDTMKVLEAAGTKWNFLPFRPGLVGGHCIGVDPYYLTFKAQEVGYHPEVILAGRRINDYMGKYIAEQTIKEMIKAGTAVKGSRVLILGFTFKENVKDVRNTRVVDICHELREYGVNPFIHDPEAEREEVREEYGIELIGNLHEFCPYSGIIAAVKHDKFSGITPAYLRSLCGNAPVLIDVKGCFDGKECGASGFGRYWRL
ncbi:MAG: nucleotide sugar dehydrogenase [Alphaproteobacteria bacterium]|uniref:Nucleotide sugar dehydrogenase n=1 Tax=Candidatus Nitrobium versatile TaxID=2884831 RepID=A0A953JEP1_9BACT|nr:nucleotide sugar dehydrogenase [Candidatus Nitrobium versatile]